MYILYFCQNLNFYFIIKLIKPDFSVEKLVSFKNETGYEQVKNSPLQQMTKRKENKQISSKLALYKEKTFLKIYETSSNSGVNVSKFHIADFVLKSKINYLKQMRSLMLKLIML